MTDAVRMEDKEPGAEGGHCGSCSSRRTVRPGHLKKALDARLARVEGQVRGIRRMIEDDQYCDDVMAQIAAARAALAKASTLVLEHHMKHCLIDRVRAGDDGIVDELIQSIQKNL